jgi:hypothetical protein
VLAWLLALLCALAPPPAKAMEEISREYRIKAAFIYNLIRFVRWPGEPSEAAPPVPGTDAGSPADHAPAASVDPWVICIYGYNPFDRYMHKLEARSVRGRRMQIRYLAEKDQGVERCHLLFISRHNTTQPQLLAQPAPYPPVLTVSDYEDFLQRGMVALVTVGNNVQLDINLTRARQAGFVVSANLLEVARTVE